MDELARCENVVAKLGGLLMTVNGWGYEKRPVPRGSAVPPSRGSQEP